MRLVGALLLALVLAGCRHKALDACASADGGAPIGPALLAFLSRSRAAHHRADAYEERGDFAGAERELEAVVGGPTPPCATAAEVREVLADTRARHADLASRDGNYIVALGDIEQGLTLVPESSYFRGHLFEVRGLVEERRSKSLAASGDSSGAISARERALTAFQEAMRIQSAVIEGATPKP